MKDNCYVLNKAFYAFSGLVCVCVKVKALNLRTQEINPYTQN